MRESPLSKFHWGIMYLRRFVAAVGAASIAVVGLGVAPAFADAEDLTASTVIDVGGSGVHSLAATADGTHLFVGWTDSTGVRIVDAATASAAGSIALADDARTLGVAPDGTLWAAQFDDGKLARISDPLGDSPSITYISVGAQAAGIAFSPDGDTVYTLVSATPGSGRRVVAVDTGTGEIVHTSAAMANVPDGVAVTADGAVWVGGDTPSVLSADLASTQAMPGATAFAGVPIVSPDGATVYVGRADDIVAIDVATRTVSGTIANAPAAFGGCGPEGCQLLGAQITHLAITPDGATLYETSYDYPWRTRIDVAAALAGRADAVELLPALVAPGQDADDSDLWQYTNDLLVVRGALWSAAGGTDGNGYVGTAVERMPIAASVTSMTATANAGDSVTIAGAGLLDSTVQIDGVAAAIESDTWSQVTFVMPALAASGSYAVTVSTPSSANVAAGTIVYTAAPASGGGSNSPSGPGGGPAVGGGGPAPSSATTTPADHVKVFGGHKAKIRGTARVGKKLTATTSAWPKGTKVTYRWYAKGKNIPKATKKTYVIGKKYAGKTIRVAITAKKVDYRTLVVTSKATKKVKARR